MTAVARTGARVLLVGEVLWDEFPQSVRLGGAPLNVAVQLSRLQQAPRLLSAVGTDVRGREATDAIAALGLDTSLVQATAQFPTGRARVQIGPGEDTSFRIERPAAYDAVDLSSAILDQIVQWDPEWIYYGTLFPSSPHSNNVLCRLLEALPRATRFYDLNLRPGFDSADLVELLLRAAHVVKLNEDELRFVHERMDLPPDAEGCCRAGASRYGWRAAAVTLGARGCAMLVGDVFVEAPGHRVEVSDPVGAGDAFAAGFIHGLASGCPADDVATAANRLGALAVVTAGAIPTGGRR